MKNQNLIIRIIADWKLSQNEQIKWRKKLKIFSMVPGIESICLDNKELFIEYDPALHSKASINAEVRAVGFPAEHLYIEPVPGL